MSRQWITYDGKDMRDFGLYVSGSHVFDSSQKAYEEIEVPGRNGSLIGTEKRFRNIELIYPSFIYSNLRENISNLRAYLLSRQGYCKLTDSYNPKEYRLAYYSGGLEAEPTSKLDAASFELTFHCKPQRYLCSGTKIFNYTATDTIINPTLFDAKPLIRVYGTGSITVNGITITITEADSYTDIDCEIMEAYKGSVLKNQYIQLDSVYFPVLSPGSNNIVLNGVTCDITPRWYTL